MSGDWPKQVRRAVQERSEGVCERCGMKKATDLHHRDRRGDGNHTIENAGHVCRACHNTIHANPETSRREGWIVVEPDTPAGHGIRYRGAWVYLDEHGDVVW